MSLNVSSSFILFVFSLFTYGHREREHQLSSSYHRLFQISFPTQESMAEWRSIGFNSDDDDDEGRRSIKFVISLTFTSFDGWVQLFVYLLSFFLISSFSSFVSFCESGLLSKVLLKLTRVLCHNESLSWNWCLWCLFSWSIHWFFSDSIELLDVCRVGCFKSVFVFFGEKC